MADTKKIKKKIVDKNDDLNINTGVYIIITGKQNGNITLNINKTDDVEQEDKNKVITNIFRVHRVSEFFDFLTKHPLTVKAEVKNDSGVNYVFSADDYKKLILLARKQQKYYIDVDLPVDTPVVDFIPRQININRGNKIQKYSQSGELLKTYIGIREATRQESISDTTLKYAITHNTIYSGFRWLFLDRDLPDDTVQDIGESVKVNTPKNAFVAMLDIEKANIVQVFQNQKTAADARKLKSSSAIYQSIVRGNLSSGHYFQYYDDCSDELKNSYLERGGVLPETHVNKGVVIKQINHITGDIIKEFTSILEVQKHFQVSSKCIKKAIATGEVTKGFKWSY